MKKKKPKQNTHTNVWVTRGHRVTQTLGLVVTQSANNLVLQKKKKKERNASAGNTPPPSRHKWTHKHMQYLGRAGRWPWAAHVPPRAGWVSSDQPGTSPAALAAPECDPLRRMTQRRRQTGKHILCFPINLWVQTHLMQKDSLLRMCIFIHCGQRDSLPALHVWMNKYWVCVFVALYCFHENTWSQNLIVMCKCA